MDLIQLIEKAKSASCYAGEKILRIYESNSFSGEIKYNKNNSPFTYADKISHLSIISVLEKTGLPVISEEDNNYLFKDRKDFEYYWLVDPLDGTKEFLSRNGEFTVNIGLIHRNLPVGGVVYVPVKKALYWALRGEGSFMRSSDGIIHRLRINKDKDIEYIITSRSHMNSATADFIAKFPDVKIIQMGSSLKALLVAENMAQLYPRFAPTMEWDTAAAQVIVEEAGGFVLAYPSLIPLTYNKVDLINDSFIVSYRWPI